MKRNFNDPTAEDGDYIELTPEERKAIYRVAAAMLIIMVFEAFIIYLVMR